MEKEGYVIVLLALMEVSVDCEFCCGLAEVALSGMVQEAVPFNKLRPLGDYLTGEVYWFVSWLTFSCPLSEAFCHQLMNVPPYYE